jgi:hypothetical protein
MGLSLWLGHDFGHIVQKEDVLTMGFQESMDVGEVWFFSKKKVKKIYVRVLGGGDDEKDIVSFPYNWLFIVG